MSGAVAVFVKVEPHMRHVHRSMFATESKCVYRVVHGAATVLEITKSVDLCVHA